MITRPVLVLFFFFIAIHSLAQIDKKEKWVDSVFKSLTPAEKIGQLIVTTLPLKPSEDEIKSLIEHSKTSEIGTLLIERSGPMRFANLMNRIQTKAKVPVMTGIEIHGDLSGTFDSTMNFYEPLVVAAASDSLTKKMSKEVDRQVKILDIHVTNRVEFLGKKKTITSKPLLDAFRKKSKPKKGDAALQDFLAGNDVLMAEPGEIDASVSVIAKALKKDKRLAGHLDSAVRKMLAKKFDVGLAQKILINTDNLIRRLHTPDAMLLRQEIAESAVTVIKNDTDLVPVRTLDDKSFASVSIGSSSQNIFTNYLSKYIRFEHYSIQNASDTTGLDEKLKDKSIVVVGLFANPDQSISDLIKKIAQKHQLILCGFIDPTGLKSFEDVGVIMSAYSGDSELQKASAEIIFGGLAARGKLPVKISEAFDAGKGITTSPTNRFTYELPETAGMDSPTLEKIETIANETITMGAAPGLVVFVAKDGKVVYEKSFGSLTYDKKSPMTTETIFDLASITKVSATLQTVMYMQEKGLIDVNKKASVYLPELKGSNKEDFTIKDIITHQAGLWPFLPFWVETVKDTTIWKKYYSKKESDDYPFPVSENLFASKAMKDSLWHWIVKARIRDKTPRTIYDYRYSDMGFYIMQHLAEKLLAQPMEDFLQKNIYQPLGAYTTGYLPLRKFSASRIAPTEKDTLFRKSLLIGYVHDQGAAMHGGIAGHAGLFSTANDLGKLGQMWLNKGTYGGVNVFKPETIELFTAKQYETSRRGLGWDKPTISDANGPTSMYASPKTFGHTGFTGTSIWVDPEFNLVFIFMSNRVNPDMNNNKILNANIRPRVQEVVYQSIFEYLRNHDSLKPNETKFGLTVKP
ncbi:hypothetical protein WSM22_09280 [Cytophagales bacterium WSM2-2]|nr:hypothetical protein WSM22_09280 [Cytophagales bacterium WSM2-2]